MSSLLNKVKGTTSDRPSEPEGTHGPHHSRVANAADPRIDSDRDNRAAHDLRGSGETYTGSSNYTTGGNNYGASERPLGTTDGPATKTDGPHKSNLMNKVDPRVDSDRDYSRNMGANPHGTSGTGAHNVNETTRIGSGAGGVSGQTSSNIPEGTYGPHGSRVANAADPRVDSDLDNTRTHGTRTSGVTGQSSDIPEGTYGPHSSRAANAADPRVDSDLDSSRNKAHTAAGGLGTTTGHYGSTTTGATSHGTHGNALGGDAARHGTTHTGTHSAAHSGVHTGTHTGAHTGAHSGTGPAPNTAGPHKSNMLNKLDPRVDSDLDGSKTIGGDKTFSSRS